MQRAYEDEKLTDIRRASRKIGKRDVADAMRRDAAEKAGVMVAFPRAREVYTTPALEAARDASVLAPREAPKSRVSDDRLATMRAEHERTAEVVIKPYQRQPEYIGHMKIFEDFSWAMFG